MKRLPCHCALTVSLCAFPVIVAAVSMFGFLCGVKLCIWQLPCSLLFESILIFYVSGHDSLKVLVAFVGCWCISVLVSMLPLMFSVTDGEVYHRAAVIMLANGWNPLATTEPAQLSAMFNGGFREFHVAFLPKLPWIYGAAHYRVFGFVEVADSFNIWSLFALVAIAYYWLKTFAINGKCLSMLLLFFIVASPIVVGGALGGVVDASLYAFLVTAIMSFDIYCHKGERWCLLIILMAVTIISGIKYTGVVWGCCLFLVYGLVAMREREKVLGLIKVGCITALLIFAINGSPYVTSSINHSSPFYPAHAFRVAERGEDKLTYDFDKKNADANEMGYAGRLAYAYLSKKLTIKYYKWKLNQDTFDPQLMIFSSIDGYGSIFRIMLLLSLGCTLFLLKSSRIKIIVIFMLLTIFATPTKFMGYSRYVAHIYLIPVLVAVGLVAESRFMKVTLLCVLVTFGYWSFLVIPQFKLYPYIWMASFQNMQILRDASQSSSSQIYSGKLNGRTIWSKDSLANIDVVAHDLKLPVIGKYCYRSCADRYTYVADHELSDFYDYQPTRIESAKAIVDKSFSVKRRKGIDRYFMREFLPKATCELHRYLFDIARLRVRQFMRNWD